MPLKTKEVRKPHPDAVEVREKRGTHSKTWAMPDGRCRCDVRVGTIQHYTNDDGSLRSCDTTIQQDAGKVFVDWLPYKFRLHDKGVGFDFQSRESGRCSVTLAGIGGKPFDGKQKLTPTIEGNKITFSEVVPGLDVVFCVLPARVKSWRIVKDANTPRTFEWLCEHDKDGRDKISDKLIGKDAAGSQLELVGEVVPVDATSFRFVETWTGNVKVRDKKTRVKSLSDVVSYPASIDPTVNSSVSTNYDDGYEVLYYGAHSSQSKNISIIGSGSSFIGVYNMVMRFHGITVPQGATITSATLSLNVTGNNTAYGGGTIYGCDQDNMPNDWYSGYSNNTTSRTKTAASTLMARPSSGGVKTYDVTSVVQEIVNRAGWASNNKMGMFVATYETTASRRQTYIEDYSDAGTDEASLSITYTAGSPPTDTTSMFQMF